MSERETYCGYIAIIGRPNVGKSTLMNKLIGQKLSITSRKPQTTRHRLLGIKTEADHQFIFVDTPGFHQNAKRAMNRMMNRTAQTALLDVDVIVWVVDATHWSEEDDWVQAKCLQVNRPLVIALNKIDEIPVKNDLLPKIARLNEHSKPRAIVPISARRGSGLESLLKILKEHLPPGPFLFPEEDITDRDQRFVLAEFLREKIVRFTSKELPYATTVHIEELQFKNKVFHVTALVWVEREGQKKILLGTGGEKMKVIGREARLEMERFLGSKVFLRIWIKVKSDWTDDEQQLTNLGFSE